MSEESVTEGPLPQGVAMRRQPKQQRSQAVASRIEEATLSLLQEQGFAALNTNAIADRAGVGIKSLYHLYPNKEAIIGRLAMGWLAAVCEAQQSDPAARRPAGHRRWCCSMRRWRSWSAALSAMAPSGMRWI